MLTLGTLLAVYGATLAAAALDFHRLAEDAPVEHLDRRIRLWVEIPGAQAPAHALREDEAEFARDEAAPQRLALGLESRLAVEPTSTVAWIRLAEARSLLEYPADDVIKPFRMSALTGRFALSSMERRIALALSLWPDLPQDLRRNVHAEIATLSPGAGQKLQLDAKELPEALQTEIKGFLRAAGLIPVAEEQQ
jgi:hypothetical protein